MDQPTLVNIDGITFDATQENGVFNDIVNLAVQIRKAGEAAYADPEDHSKWEALNDLRDAYWQAKVDLDL